MLKSAIWWTTWACNFSCVYCWQVQAQKIGEYQPQGFGLHPGHRWVKVWNKLQPAILDITGGEPFLMPGFAAMVSEFHPNIKVAITTNLSKPIEEFLEHVDTAHILSMTCSLHPTEGKIPEALFYGRAMQLQRRGIKIIVNMVAWPEQIWMLRHYKRITEQRGLAFHVDPYGPRYKPVVLSDAEKAAAGELIGPDRGPSALAVKHGKDYTVNCSGGMTHLNVHPDGTAYRCILDAQLGKPAVGNVFDEAFSLNRERTPCADHYQCPSCDRDKVLVELAT